MAPRRFTSLRSLSDTPRRVAGLVLAAGGSARLGVPKQLLEFRGEALVCRAARAVAEAGASPVIVVLGARAAEIAHALRAFPSIALVTNERWRDGLASSLAIGLREVKRLAPSSDGVLVTTADQPLVSGAMLRRLVDELTEQSGLVAAK